MGKVIDITHILEQKKLEEEIENYTDWDYFKDILGEEEFYNYTVSYIVSTALNMLKKTDHEGRVILVNELAIALEHLVDLVCK